MNEVKVGITLVVLLVVLNGCMAYHGDRWNFATPGIESTIDGSTIDTKIIPAHIGSFK